MRWFCAQETASEMRNEHNAVIVLIESAWVCEVKSRRQKKPTTPTYGFRLRHSLPVLAKEIHILRSMFVGTRALSHRPPENPHSFNYAFGTQKALRKDNIFAALGAV